MHVHQRYVRCTTELQTGVRDRSRLHQFFGLYSKEMSGSVRWIMRFQHELRGAESSTYMPML